MIDKIYFVDDSAPAPIPRVASSSFGMLLRLGSAIAIQVPFDILLIDKVLAHMET